MKLKYFYILIFIFISGCNEFIDLTGKFINRINDTQNLNTVITVSIQNNSSEQLPNILVYIIDDHDSLLITPPKYTNSKSNLTIILPDEQVKGISRDAQNLIVFAEHPDIGIYSSPLSLALLKDNPNVKSEFYIDIPAVSIDKKSILLFNLYNYLSKKHN